MARPKGWFEIPGVQKGDRTIEQQLKGLGPLLEEIEGKTVLDLGCAEGLISHTLLLRGAKKAYLVDFVPENIRVASTLQPRHKLDAVVHDLNDLEDTRKLLADIRFDVVLMLAILHKLRKPLELVREVIAHAPGLIVIRTAASTPGFVQDPRSSFERFDFQPLLRDAGYALERVTSGSFNEWMGYFRLPKE